MKRNVTIEAIVGCCAFIALMCGGFYWFFSLIDVHFNFLNTIKWICSIILVVIAVVCGWMWLRNAKMNNTLKIVLEVLFVIFAILAIWGFIKY
ncbi:MAG: hypothetical protein IKP77_06755 [Acholeplasmatales bacterium]|nr:hypothetical protein [Acholeplasmatales bacterium]